MSQSFGNNFHNSVRRVVKCSLKKQSRENQIPGFSGKRNKKTDSIQPHMAVSQIGELRSGCKEYFFSFDCRLSRKSLFFACLIWLTSFVFLGIQLRYQDQPDACCTYPQRKRKESFCRAPRRGRFIHSPWLTPPGFPPSDADQGENSLTSLFANHGYLFLEQETFNFCKERGHGHHTQKKRNFKLTEMQLEKAIQRKSNSRLLREKK